MPRPASRLYKSTSAKPASTHPVAARPAKAGLYQAGLYTEESSLTNELVSLRSLKTITAPLSRS